MDEVAAYLAFSGAIGLLQVRDNYNLHVQREGEWLVLDRSFSVLEFVWFFVSAAILAASELSLMETLVPILYIAYNVYGWIYGVKIYMEAQNNDEETIAVSPTYIIGNLVYCIAFSIFCWFTVYLHYRI